MALTLPLREDAAAPRRGACASSARQGPWRPGSKLPCGIATAKAGRSRSTAPGDARRGGLELPRRGDLLLVVTVAVIAALYVLTALLVAQASASVGSGGVEVVTQLPSICPDLMRAW